MCFVQKHNIRKSIIKSRKFLRIKKNTILRIDCVQRVAMGSRRQDRKTDKSGLSEIVKLVVFFIFKTFGNIYRRNGYVLPFTRIDFPVGYARRATWLAVILGSWLRSFRIKCLRSRASLNRSFICSRTCCGE